MSPGEPFPRSVRERRLVCLLRGERRRALWVAYTLTNIAAIYTHYYAALALLAQAVDVSYIVFTHLLDGHERIWGQVDAVEAGLYDAVTGVRLPVFDEAGERVPGDRILLRPVELPSARP